MARGVASAGTKQSNTKKAKREFEKWDKERYDIFDKNDNKLVLHDDEVFVPAWDYIKRKKDTDGCKYVNVKNSRKQKKVPSNYRLDKGESYVYAPDFDFSYRVSNYGNVISFKFFGTDSPILMIQSEATGGYLQVADRWNVHQLVWFSFMADAIERKKKNPDAELPYEEPLEYGHGIDDLTDLKYIAKHAADEVHHRDADNHNNKLSNLELLPIDIHDLLTDMKNTKDPEKQWDKFFQGRNLFKDEATVVRADEIDTSVFSSTQDQLLKKFTPRLRLELFDFYWSALSKWVLEQTLATFGKRFFSRDIILFAKHPAGLIAYIKYRREKGGITVEKLGLPLKESVNIDIYWIGDRLCYDADIVAELEKKPID